MGSGGVAIAALPTVICLKVPFSDGLGEGQILLWFIIIRLSPTIVTCIHQSMSKQSNSPSPSGEVRWGLMFID